MTKIEEIEKAVSKLSPEDMAKFRAWFEKFDAQQFDQRIEQDAKSGKLEKLAEEALSDHRADRSRTL